MIGIISWLPEEEVKRNIRYWRMRGLLKNLRKLFPKEKILIIAQDYTDGDVEAIDIGNVEVHRYSRLGIVGARNALKRDFLATNEQYLFMYDDDCDLRWHDDNAGKYTLECLLNNPYGVVFQTTHSCKNVGIRREVLEQITFRSLDGEHDYYEDGAYWDDLIKVLGVENDFTVLFPSCQRAYIDDRSPYGGETYRTWTTDDIAQEGA